MTDTYVILTGNDSINSHLANQLAKNNMSYYFVTEQCEVMFIKNALDQAPVHNPTQYVVKGDNTYYPSRDNLALGSQ